MAVALACGPIERAFRRRRRIRSSSKFGLALVDPFFLVPVFQFVRAIRRER